MKPRLYLDEDIYPDLPRALRKRGIDAEGANELHRYGYGDDEQLAYAVERRRVLVSFNRDHYLSLALECFSTGMPHWGIVVSQQYEFGELLRRLVRLCETYSGEDLIDQIIYLQAIR